jgi:hypothetical protein
MGSRSRSLCADAHVLLRRRVRSIAEQWRMPPSRAALSAPLRPLTGPGPQRRQQVAGRAEAVPLDT